MRLLKKGNEGAAASVQEANRVGLCTWVGQRAEKAWRQFCGIEYGRKGWPRKGTVEGGGCWMAWSVDIVTPCTDIVSPWF